METEHVTQRLKSLRTRAGMSMADVAKALGLRGPSSYQRYEDEALTKDDSIPFKVVKKLLPILVGKGSPPVMEIEVLALAGTGLQETVLASGARMIPVYGRVAAGIWQEDDEVAQEAVHHIPFTSDVRYPGRIQYARLVEGESMNVLFPNGSYAVIVEPFAEPRNDDIVVVKRKRAGFVERTLKRVKRVNNHIELHPESRDPRFERIILNGDADTEIEIEGYAIGVYTPL